MKISAGTEKDIFKREGELKKKTHQQNQN